MRLSRIYPVVAVLAMVALSACSKTDDAEDGGIPEGNLISLFEPTAGTVPFPFDGLFSGFTDPTLNIPQTAAPALDANRTDGFSTTGNIFTDFIGFLDFETTAEGLLVFELPEGAAPRRLEQGVDYSVSDYPATSATPATGGTTIDCQPDGSNRAPISCVRTRLLISPLKPLRPSTRHVVIATDALRDVNGNAAVPSTQFRIIRRTTPVQQQDDPTVVAMSEPVRTTLATLQSSLIGPVLQGVIQITGLPRDRIVLAWPFTTQSIGETLSRISAAADDRAAADADAPLSILAAPSGQTLANIGAPNLADIFVGAVDLPYYSNAPDAETPDAIINTGFWLADATQPNTGTQENPVMFLGQVQCAAFALGLGGLQPSESTTRCFPVPVERSIQRAPLLITVPNQVAKPAEGWPVVIFQHGITSDRTAMLALAPRLSAAGFVVVSMDLPLHGVPPADCAEDPNPLCPARQQIRAANALFGSRERTFDVDLQAPEGPDSSGTHFINLASLITSRENNRQAVADLFHLRAMLSRLELDADPGADIDPGRVYFFGHSLGGIVGTTFMALDENVRAASVANPGGGIAKLLDGSASFGPVIRAGLGAAGGPQDGMDEFETFLRFAQHLIDDGDPINYAARLVDRPVHFIEVVGDLVVPNSVPRNPATGGNPALDVVTIQGPLSGSTPLITQLGLDVEAVEDVGSISPETFLGADARRAVRFSQGDHSVVLTPSTSPVNAEMQTQIVNFLASDGQCLPIGGNCGE
jgi:dienelactone hydrolase